MKYLVLIPDGGVRFEVVLENGVCRLENLPVYLLLDTLTIECGEDTYTYSVSAYKAELEEVYRPRADILYTYIYYVNELYLVALGA